MCSFLYLICLLFKEKLEKGNIVKDKSVKEKPQTTFIDSDLEHQGTICNKLC